LKAVEPAKGGNLAIFCDLRIRVFQWAFASGDFIRPERRKIKPAAQQTKNGAKFRSL